MKILSVFGTRPEAIKMAPLVKRLNETSSIEHKVCSTGQHRQMLAQVMHFFEIRADFDLDIMQPGQDLTDSTCRILTGMRAVFADFRPDWVLVHGDTTTCFATTLAAFYAGIKVGHVEAGLRTGNLQAPFPEEANRLLVDRLASAYFAPTQRNVDTLIQEGIAPDRIVLTGNTVIDALLWAKKKIQGFSEKVSINVREVFDSGHRILLVTGHRRENFGEGFKQITLAIQTLAERYPDLAIVYPVHLNPHVQQAVQAHLANIPNVFLTAPFDYPDFVFAMKNAWLILTDSGGVQEEAPSLGKHVLVMRDTTERPEALEAGTVQLVGANCHKIIEAVSNFRDNPLPLHTTTPYGDGKASERIVRFLVPSLL